MQHRSTIARRRWRGCRENRFFSGKILEALAVEVAADHLIFPRCLSAENVKNGQVFALNFYRACRLYYSAYTSQHFRMPKEKIRCKLFN